VTGLKADGTKFTEKEKYDALVEIIQTNSEGSHGTKAQVSDDPYMMRYNLEKQLSGDQFNPIQYFQREAQISQILSLEPKEYLENFFKNQVNEDKTRKYSDEEIGAHIGKMNKIEMENQVRQMKGQFVQSLEAQDKERYGELLGKLSESFKAEEEENAQTINKYISENKNNRKFLGIELSEADHTDYLKELPELIKRDQKTGVNKFEAYMQSNDVFSQIMPLLYLSMKGKLPAYISDIKEQTKLNLKGKLGTGTQDDPGGKAGAPGLDINRMLDNV